MLVRGEALVVDAHGARVRETIALTDADIHGVEQRNRELKRKERAGHATVHDRAERARLVELATLLCAVKAHARGKVHLGGDLQRQEVWIREHARLTQPGQGARALSLVVDQWEVVIEEGQRLEVEGFARRVPLAHDLAPGGYRDSPTCLVLDAPDGGELRALGVGELARRAEPPPPGPPAGRKAARASRTPSSRPPQAVRGGAAIAVAVVVATVVTSLWLLLSPR